MSSKDSKMEQSFTDKIIQPKIVKYCTLVGLSVFLICVFVGYLVAQLDPQGYNMVDNF